MTKEELVSFLQMVAYLSRYIDRFSSRCEPLRRLTKANTKFEWGPQQQQAFDNLKLTLTLAPVLVPYHPRRETLVMVDGSPEGLDGALLQKTSDGFQPVHYVSRTLTDTEKRYSQIEREALAAEFTTSRLQMYLLGAQKFKLATDHKPLLPLLNNPKAKIQPRIERIIIKMQNLDFEAIHIPGKSNMTDYLSRHPLPETGKDHVEKYVNAAIQADHAIVWSKIKEATAEDKELTELTETIETGNWEEAKQFLKPYYKIRDELFVADGVIMRMDRIVPPQSLRQRIIQSAHKQGHLGVSKTKEMIRRKYWFPGMNTRIIDMVQSYFDCQIATDQHHTEPAKMTELPDRPWDVVEADFCGPLPNHKHALVLTDQYSRYPEVEMVTSTSITPVTKKLKKIFSTHGIPRVLQTDNGPPFNGERFQAFAAEMGFHHKRVTPTHPKSQGQVENFNKLINKTTKIACEEGIEIESAIYDMLQAYRQTPHPATKSTPYEILMHRQVRTRLEHFPTEVHITQEEVKKNDETYKQKRKQYHDKRHRVETHTIKCGDAVLIKREKKRKKHTPYEPYIYIVISVKGSTIRARRVKDGKEKCRDASKVKPLRTARLLNVNDETANVKVPSGYKSTTSTMIHQDMDGSNVGNTLNETATMTTETRDTTNGSRLRRSERLKKSTYLGKYKDYIK